MCMTAAIIGSSVVSSVVSAAGSRRAAQAQTDAAAEQAAVQERIYSENVERFQPFYEGGLTAQNALMYELGLGPTPNVGDRTFGTRADAEAFRGTLGGGQQYGGFRATPGYQFRVQEGVNALDASGAARGGLFSGATGEALTQFGQGIASQEYGNYMNRLAGLASSGQNAAGQGAAAGQNYATGMTNALGAMGNAQAAGAIGTANAINSGVNNWLGYQQFQRLMA